MLFNVPNKKPPQKHFGDAFAAACCFSAKPGGILVRRDAIGFAETGDKIGLRAKAQVIGHHLLIAFPTQHRLCGFELPLNNIFPQRLAYELTPKS